MLCLLRLAWLMPLWALVAQAATYTNPVKQFQGGDPSLVWQDGYYYLMATNQVDLRISRATTLDGLNNGEVKLAHKDTQLNRSREVWAPELHRLEGIWYIYYTASSPTADVHRMYVLRGGSSPWDDYTDLGPVNTPGWAIDGSLLHIGSSNYFVYSCKRNDTGTELQSLCIAQHYTPTTIGSEHLLSQPLAPWERQDVPVNEGPFALYHHGRTWLTFSSSFCATTMYNLGLLSYHGGNPLDRSSWTKSNGPVFTGTSSVVGAGHNSFFTSPDGTELFMTYHSTPNATGDCGNYRYTNTKKIAFDGNGNPVFGQPSPYGEELAVPSGQR